MSVSSCVAIAVKPVARERALEQPDVRRVDVALLRVRDLGRLEVRALDETKVRRERQQRREVGLAADRGTPGGRRRRCRGRPRGAAVDAERRLDARRLLHVDADEVAVPRRVLDELGEVPVRELLVEREAEMRELERDVRAEPFRVRSGRAARGRRRRPRAVSASVVTPSPSSVVFVSRPLLVQAAGGRAPPRRGFHRRRSATAPSRKPYRCTNRAGAGCPRRRGGSGCGAALSPTPRRSARPRRAPRRSGRVAARTPRGRPARRGSRARSSTPRGTGSAAARRAARSPSPAPPESVADERDDSVGEARGETETGTGRTRREAALEQRLGADEDVEPVEEVRLDLLPRDCPRPSSRRGSARARAAARSRRAGSRSRSAPRTRRA